MKTDKNCINAQTYQFNLSTILSYLSLINKKVTKKARHISDPGVLIQSTETMDLYSIGPFTIFDFFLKLFVHGIPLRITAM